MFYTRAGQQISRARPEFVRNPRTEKQVLRRAYLGAISRFAKALDSALDIGYAPRVDALVSSRNLFVKDNYDRIGGTAADVTIRYEDVALTIPQPDVNAMAMGEANFATPLTVTIPVDDPYSDPDWGKATDGCVVAVYSKTNGLAVVKTIANARSEQNLTVTAPSFWQGHYVEVWMFCTRGEGSDVKSSATIYCGNGRIA